MQAEYSNVYALTAFLKNLNITLTKLFFVSVANSAQYLAAVALGLRIRPRKKIV